MAVCSVRSNEFTGVMNPESPSTPALALGTTMRSARAGPGRVKSENRAGSSDLFKMQRISFSFGAGGIPRENT
jgi:hypothetical protein